MNNIEIEKLVNASLEKIKSHPFIYSANNNAISKEALERWVFCAGRESKSFPTILENLIKTISNKAIKEILMGNLDDEYGNGNKEHAHFNHYLQLLDNIGISRNKFEDYSEKSGIKYALELAYSVSRASNLPVSLGYMLVNEGMTQITYSAVKNALSSYYKNLKTNFFDIHIEVDERHVNELYCAMNHLEDDNFVDIKNGVLLGERGMLTLLDEVYGLLDY